MPWRQHSYHTVRNPLLEPASKWHAGADPEPPMPGGAQVTNEAKGFTEARSAERGRVGEGVIPSRRWGSGGPPPEIF